VSHDLGGFAGPSLAAQTIVAEMLASSVSARVAGAYAAVLPALAAAYADHTPAASASADGPVARVLLRVRADLDADLVAGEALLRGAGAGGLPAAAEWKDRLAETGGISAAPEGASGGTTLR
jgi:hypothetical protein